MTDHDVRLGRKAIEAIVLVLNESHIDENTKDRETREIARNVLSAIRDAGIVLTSV